MANGWYRSVEPRPVRVAESDYDCDAYRENRLLAGMTALGSEVAGVLDQLAPDSQQPRMQPPPSGRRRQPDR
jgi:hypothetical protein